MDTLDREERELRAAVIALAPVKQNRRFEGTLAARIVAHTERRLARGDTIAAVCAGLDIAHQTLTRLIDKSKSTRALVPVVVREAEREQRALMLRGPCGVTVEGSADEIAAVIARLSCSA